MQYTRTFKEALALSIQSNCILWADAESTIFDVDTISSFAEIADSEHPLPDGKLYAISAEGAIGFLDDYEFDIDWIFYPVLDQEVVGKYIQALQEEAEEPMKKERSSGRYCPQCGKKVARTAKFCPECGAKL